MSENNEKKEKIIPDFIKEIIEAGRNHVDTPSEKICNLSLDRDKIYDKVKKLEKDLETAKENNEDCTFLEAQLQHLKDYKKLLGDQIKKLVDET